MSDDPNAVVSHYGDGGLRQRIEQGLTAAGVDLRAVTTRDLAPVDEFHSRGRLATRELAALVAPVSGERVLDVGSGLGGPARYLAETFGCEVTGIDLTPEFCEVGNWLSELTGLSPKVRLETGSGTALPLPDGHFDLAWTMQMQMNISDKARLYREIHRVLRPGGRFVLQELAQGAGGPCHLPAPWSSHPATSHLVSPDDLRGVVEAAGFVTTEWRDTTDDALAWYAQHNSKVDAALPVLGTHLVMGDDHERKRHNVQRNYREGRLHQVMGAFRRGD